LLNRTDLNTLAFIVFILKPDSIFKAKGLPERPLVILSQRAKITNVPNGGQMPSAAVTGWIFTVGSLEE
jgi:hypothetical protein